MDIPCTLEVLHWITIFIYVFVIVKAFTTLPHVKYCHKIPKLRPLIYLYITSLISMSSIFIFLQIEWIVLNHDSVVGNSTAILWSLYDILNGFVQVFYLLGLEVYLKWKCEYLKDNECAHRRRQTDL
jgi:hypothetical protein